MKHHDSLRHALGGYREYSVPVDLQPIAEAAWCYSRGEGEAPIPGRGHRVLPETGVSICFWSRRDGRGIVSDPQLTIIGPAPGIHFFNPPPGMHLEAVRLKAEWSRDLLHLDPIEYRNETRQERSMPRLRESLARSRSSSEALEILLNELRRLRATRVERSTTIAHDAMERLRSGRAVSELWRDLHVSERQLRRAVIATTGLSAKHGQRIMRLNRLAAAADREPHPDWPALALDAGFYDQSHMIDDVRELTGLTPSALHRERRMQLV
ncbi:MAG TPA: helix-turn-helix domain-containing protein [Thermoanaerobaculia bacterium]|nr:helix-turn-helix domain-containing protein [Thermoanaerobaculia bacterium]